MNEAGAGRAGTAGSTEGQRDPGGTGLGQQDAAATGSGQAAADAVILFGHGARDARWARPFERVRDRMRAAMPQRTVQLAYLEFMEPDLPTAIDRLAESGARRIVLMPLFLGAGGHVLRDLPELLDTARARHANLSIEALPALGEHEAVLDAIADGCIGLVDGRADGRVVGPSGC